MLRIDYPFKKQILACGAQKQAGFCLTKKNCAFVIDNLGNMDENAVFARYQQEIERIKNEFKIKPQIITHDLHGECSSTKFAQSLQGKIKGVKLLPVQHHHAHLASCIGENAMEEKTIGVVFDSTGLGEDNHFWGGEFFVGDLRCFKRVAHLKYLPFLNGEKNNFNFWQQTACYLYQSIGEEIFDLQIDFVRRRSADNWQLFKKDLQNSPCFTSSMSELFDAVSILLELREKIDYEGQGVQDLERIVNRSSHVAGKIYQFKLEKEKEKLLIHPEQIVQGVVTDIKNNISKSIISAAFHNTIVEIVKNVCNSIRQEEKTKNVILTGSVFQNKVLFKRLKDLLEMEGFKVIAHKHFPVNDNNIAFGQAVLASVR